MSAHNIAGIELFYREAGDGPAVLLVHGTGLNADAWPTLSEELATDRRVISYDRRGFSRSQAPPAATWQRHAEDAAALLTARGAGPATVAGWGSGGTIALELAIAMPELVNGLVLVEPLFMPRKHVTPAFLRAYLKLQVLRRLGRPDAAIDAFSRHTTSWRSGGNAWDRDDYPADRRAAARANTPAVFAEMALPEPDVSAARLARLSSPVTVVMGSESPVYFERMARAAAEAIPGAGLEIVPGANHVETHTRTEVCEMIRAMSRNGALAHR